MAKFRPFRPGAGPARLRWPTGAAGGTLLADDLTFDDALAARAAAMAASEQGADTLAAAGTLTAQQGRAATLTATESASDTATIAAKALVKAAAAATEPAKDVAAIAARVVVKSSVSATESGADALAATGAATPARVAGLGGTEAGADSAQIQARVVVKSTFVAAETVADSASAAGSVAQGARAATLVSVAVAVTEHADFAVIRQSPAPAAQNGYSTIYGGGLSESMLALQRRLDRLAVPAPKAKRRRRRDDPEPAPEPSAAPSAVLEPVQTYPAMPWLAPPVTWRQSQPISYQRTKKKAAAVVANTGIEAIKKEANAMSIGMRQEAEDLALAIEDDDEEAIAALLAHMD